MANGRVSCSVEELLEILRVAISRNDSNQIGDCCDALVRGKWDFPAQVANVMHHLEKKCPDYTCRRTIRRRAAQLTEEACGVKAKNRQATKRPAVRRRSPRALSRAVS